MKTKRMDELFSEVDSRYALVNAVAQRAREISENAENNDEILIEKPVLVAIDELQKGKTKIVLADSEEAQKVTVASKKIEIRTANTGTLIDFDDEDEDDDNEDEDDENDGYEYDDEDEDENFDDEDEDDDFDDEDDIEE